MKLLSIFLLLYAAPLLATAQAATPAAGEKIAIQGNGRGATACVACHGAQGEGNAQAGFPRLAGLNADYLLHQLKSIKQGTRINPIMKPLIEAMNEQDMANVSAYYAGLEPPAAPAATDANAELLQEGKRLAEIGNWNEEIPACVSCHGPDGHGAGSVFPALAGQPASYLATQIKDWKSGQRTNDPNQLMQVVAERMSERETQAVAAYFASLAPSTD